MLKEDQELKLKEQIAVLEEKNIKIMNAGAEQMAKNREEYEKMTAGQQD
jgi:hypothetical protein